MRRRDLLAAMGAAGFAHAALSRIIDTHTHFYDPSRPGGVPWPPAGDALLYRRVMPADFEKVTRGLGVAGTVVVEASPLLEDNQWILDLAQQSKVIVGFVGHLDPGAAAFAEQLRRFTRNPLFRGIRLNGEAIAKGLAMPQFVAGLERMGDAGLTLDAIGPAAMFPDLERAAHRVPKLKIVIDHLPFDRQQGLPRAENIYAKVSGVRPDTPAERLEELWSAYGPDRLVYGSNWPVSERAAPYGEILRIVAAYFASKSAEAADKYFRRNSEKAYGWISR